jgi:hypothetical protein
MLQKELMGARRKIERERDREIGREGERERDMCVRLHWMKIL